MQREKGEDKSSTAAVRGSARVHSKLCRYSARNSLYPQTVFHCMENFSVFFYAFRRMFHAVHLKTPMAWDLLMPDGVVSSDHSQFN